MATQVTEWAATGARPQQVSRIRSGRLSLWVPGIVLALIALACFAGPLIFGLPGPNAGDLAQGSLPPLSPGHLLGTDQLGNDLLSRALYGGRVSIEVGLGSVAAGILIGGSLGTIAGYKAGVVESLLMRVFDLFLAFPSLVLALAVAGYLGPSEENVIIAISCFTIPAFARMARATVLGVRDQPFIVSARISGGTDRYVLTRHIAPNVLPPLLTFGCLTVASAMVIEAALSFLGLGVRPPAPSWGSMIASGQTYLTMDPWMVIVPAAFLFLCVLFLNLLADALRARIRES
jgi:peptide/nickel transport system permease protein